MRFVEFIEEDDGTTTLVAEDEAGKLHEFRNVKIQSVHDGALEMSEGGSVTSIPLEMTVTKVEEEP